MGWDAVGGEIRVTVENVVGKEEKSENAESTDDSELVHWPVQAGHHPHLFHGSQTIVGWWFDQER